jgi:hypothetical protein
MKRRQWSLRLVLVLALAGVAAALAFASPTFAGDGTTTGATTTTQGDDHHNGKKDEHHKSNRTCENVELRGTNGSGSVAFTVAKASHKASSLVGKQVTLTVPAGATLHAKACMDASGALTLRVLKVDEHHHGSTTTTTTAGTTTTH